MKKGTKLPENGYLVEISDLDNNYLFPPRISTSLRQAVAYAAANVAAMENYLKVYRDFTSKKGAYLLIVFNEYSDAPIEHIVVKIRSFDNCTSEGLARITDFLLDEARSFRERSLSRSTS